MQPKRAVGGTIPGPETRDAGDNNPMTLAHCDVLDREIILDRVGGDEELMREIVSIFKDEYPVLLDSIREAVAAGDARTLESAAHTLKGAVANFGAEAATGAAFDLEKIGRRGNLEAAPAALAELERQFRSLAPALDALAS